ncbi:MAG: YebC/PmpR family DNA-binding transcriptional regulator, partial [Parvibaculaceae bacterium]
RSHFTKFAGNLGETGSVSFMFDRAGEIVYPASAGSADAMLEAAIEAGADDVASDEESHTVTCAFENIGEVSSALEEKLGEATSTKVVWRPKTMAPVDEDTASTILKLISALEADDDVQAVFANLEVSDEILERLTAA